MEHLIWKYSSLLAVLTIDLVRTLSFLITRSHYTHPQSPFVSRNHHHHLPDNKLYFFPVTPPPWTRIIKNLCPEGSRSLAPSTYRRIQNLCFPHFYLHNSSVVAYFIIATNWKLLPQVSARFCEGGSHKCLPPKGNFAKNTEKPSVLMEKFPPPMCP